MVALAEPPVVGSGHQQWLNSEMLTMFMYHHMRELTQTEELHILNKLVSVSNPATTARHNARCYGSDVNLCTCVVSTLYVVVLVKDWCVKLVAVTCPCYKLNKVHSLM